jgi:hypothetical protein
MRCVKSPIAVISISRQVVEFLRGLVFDVLLMNLHHRELHYLSGRYGAPVLQFVLAAVYRLNENEIKFTATYAETAMLLIEGQRPGGACWCMRLNVKLSTLSGEGKTMTTPSRVPSTKWPTLKKPYVTIPPSEYWVRWIGNSLPPSLR